MDKNMFSFYKAALNGEISTPLCSEYKASWRKCGDNKEMLVRLSLSQQALPFVATHAYQKKGLTKEYIKEHFKEYINGKILEDCDGVDGYTYALYVDWDYENDLNIETDVASVMWTTGANIVIPQCKCPTIYLSNKSNVHVVGEGFNTVNIKLFDESKVTVEDIDKDSEVIVYKYSDKAAIEEGKYCFGKVKVFNKELRL